MFTQRTKLVAIKVAKTILKNTRGKVGNYLAFFYVSNTRKYNSSFGLVTAT